MQKLITLCALCFIVYSCNNKTATADFKGTDTTAALQAAPVAKASEIDGLWTGVFGSSAADTILQNKASAFAEAYYKKLNGSGDEEGEGEEITDIKLIPAELRPAYYMEPLNGYYALRSANKITVIINGIDEAGQLTGTSVCAGNERPLKGTYTKTGSGFEAELKEPGDDKNDGIFHLAFSPASGKVTGTWTSLTGNTKSCELEKKEFKYDPEAGSVEGFRQKNKDGYIAFKKNPSTDLLKTADVENLTRPELTILRNLIYARHGYTFASASFRNYFESQDWYIPYRKDIRSDLTEKEKLNAEKLKSFEKYASAAYDEFGR